MAGSSFRDRVEAGQALAQKLRESSIPPDAVVLGLPRGGVPVAWEIARELGLELDIINLRKLGLPGQPELAMGAIAEDGTRYLNTLLVDQLHIPQEAIERVEAEEKAVMAVRTRLFRDVRPQADVTGRTVILVDDGVATGATMKLAVQVLRKRGADWIIVAVPVGPPGTIERFSEVADQCVCLLEPPRFSSVGLWYLDFNQVSEDEVIQALKASMADLRGRNPEGT
ncbi:Predicted phosphoribosyltransferase [Marinobacter segnicrescens]|uniref:Predicted phosphoribosyltransferase n=1 Tax=Marinobacter segnicrescens TaxID=430453 RepID=A0A1H9ZA69_9GAMM|nr:phosphoribosyltransferase [Marinobacter segnicrescens]SES78454.1 Predicted phosphoribosyltransferase [Marinobacter segnicrescens]